MAAPRGWAASRLPPALSARLRALAQEEPNFGILFDGGVGRLTFAHLVERLEALRPLLPDEIAACTFCLSRYVDTQLRSGALHNLPGVQALFAPLGLTDLPLSPDTVRDLSVWLERIPVEDWMALSKGYRLRGERNGTVFESRWYQDFIPNYIPDGVERAFLAYAMAYLKAENAWVKGNGLEPEQLAPAVKARETLIRLAKRSPAQRKAGLPGSVGLLLKFLEKP